MPRKPKNTCEPQNLSSEYLSYADLPPPSPDERAALQARIEALYRRAHAQFEKDRLEALWRWRDFAP